MSSATPGDDGKLREMIVNFYTIAGESPPSQLKINDKVATVFAEILHEAEKCSRRIAKVPQIGRASCRERVASPV